MTPYNSNGNRSILEDKEQHGDLVNFGIDRSRATLVLIEVEIPQVNPKEAPRPKRKRERC